MRMRDLPPDVSRELTRLYGPVLATFTLDQVPESAAPISIREQWVGITLPVRERALAKLAFGQIEYFDILSFNEKSNPDPVSISGYEAVDALDEAGRDDAVDFWAPYSEGEFTFRGYEGTLVSIEGEDSTKR